MPGYVMTSPHRVPKASWRRIVKEQERQRGRGQRLASPVCTQGYSSRLKHGESESRKIDDFGTDFAILHSRNGSNINVTVKHVRGTRRHGDTQGRAFTAGDAEGAGNGPTHGKIGLSGSRPDLLSLQDLRIFCDLYPELQSWVSSRSSAEPMRAAWLPNPCGMSLLMDV